MTKFDSLKPTESDIQETILEWLRLKGIFCFHMYGTAQYKNTVRMAGVPDIIGNLPDGKALYIEVKDHKGKVSEAQYNFIGNRQNENCIAFVARSLEDVEFALSNYKKHD